VKRANAASCQRPTSIFFLTSVHVLSAFSSNFPQPAKQIPTHTNGSVW